jgi:hypothetical protein
MQHSRFETIGDGETDQIDIRIGARVFGGAIHCSAPSRFDKSELSD